MTIVLAFVVILLLPLWAVLLFIACVMTWTILLIVIAMLITAVSWIFGYPIDVTHKEKRVGYIRWFKYHKV